MDISSRWRWAGVVIVDDAGNIVSWELSNPRGTISVESELSRASLLDGTVFATGAISTNIRVTLEGEARDWRTGRQAAPDDDRTRNVGIVGHPQAGKTLLGKDAKALTEKPYITGEGQ